MQPHTVVLAGDVFNWITEKTNWFKTTLPVLFFTFVMGFGLWLLIITRGGIRKVFVFALGAAVVYMLLKNVDAIANMFHSEVTG